MKILLVNPNSTATMTEKIGQSARAVAFADTTIIARNPTNAPASIEGQYDEAMCVPGLLATVRQAMEEGIDGVVVACFDDPGIGACREITDVPVVGICQAAMLCASMIATGFSVVTTLARSVPLIEKLAWQYGMERFCKKVRAADIPVLALEQNGTMAREKLRAEILQAARQDGAEAIILGCAGMADLPDWLAKEAGMPVIDGVAAATKLIEAMAGANLRTSKIGAYAPPLTKDCL